MNALPVSPFFMNKGMSTYTQKKARLILPNSPSFNRNELFQATDITDLKIEYSSSKPTVITKGEDKIYQFFSTTGNIVGSCLNQKSLEPNSANCWVKLSRDHFIIQGKQVKVV
jgi:hypothetical protein